MRCARCGAPATHKVDAIKAPISFEAVELDVCEECFYSWRPEIGRGGEIRWKKRGTITRKLLLIAVGSKRLARLVEKIAESWIGGLLSSRPFYWIGLAALPILPILLFYSIALHFVNPEPILKWKSIASSRPGLGTLIPLLDPLTISLNFWVAFLIAAVLHELAHAVVASRAGIKPTSVNLLFLGPIPFGIYVESPRVIKDVKVYAAGPAANITFAGVLAMVMAFLGKWQLILLPPEIFAVLGLPVEAPPALATISWIAFMNFWIVGLINASPLFPSLAGQGILSVYLWRKLGKRGAKAGFYISLGLGIVTAALIVVQSLPARL